MNNPPDFWRPDYPFQIACVQAPPPPRKNRRRDVCGEGVTVHRPFSDGWSISSSSGKTANKKIPVSSVFHDSEGLYRTTVCCCLVRRPHYSARIMRFGPRGPSEFATEMPWPRLRGKTIWVTISFTVNSFLPYLRLTVKIFQFLRLSTKFLALLRLSVNPIETLLITLYKCQLLDF